MPGKIIEINEEEVKAHLGEFVRETVEETLNAMLNTQTFYSWFYTEGLKREKKQNTFVEIVTENDAQGKENEHRRSMTIGITLPNGYNLIISSGFQTHTLNAVLDVLEGR